MRFRSGFARHAGPERASLHVQDHQTQSGDDEPAFGPAGGLAGATLRSRWERRARGIVRRMEMGCQDAL